VSAAFILARLTFREAWRRRIALAALVLGGAFLLLYSVGFYFIRNEALSNGASLETAAARGAINFLFIAGLYAVNFLTLAMGALLAADTLAGEINSGTVQSLVTKPIRRVDVVLGKWLGFAGMLGVYLLVMAGGVILGVWAITGYTAPNLPGALALMYLTALLVMTITLACSSRLSALATGGTVFGLYGLAFIGGWVEQIGSVLQNQTAINVGILSSLIIPSEALWKRAAQEMSSPLMRLAGGLNPFTAASPPSDLMIVYGVGYLLLMLGLAVYWFRQRDL
jgi:ABC-type transport system involved in multi-copper enzyme maturation permease subunit